MEATRLCPYCLQPLPGAAQSCPHCGKSFAGRNPGGTLPVGTVLAGRYTVGEMLSIDGEGILYRGAENLGRFRVTIKEYLPITLTAERTAESTLRPKTGSEVLFKTTRMDFADLYRSIQRITPANGLEAVLDVVEANNSVYAILENLGGTPLDQWLENHPGTIRPDDACTMLQPVFEGVAAMHKIGLVHRGICPENIRVMENDRCRLAGYATVGLRTAGSGLHEQLYEGYSAPEQYSTAEFEGRYTDEYSLAAVFYRMVCGQAPVPAAQRMVTDSNPRAKSVNGSLPLYVSQVLQLGLRLRPMERIQTVPQLYQALSSKEYTAELTRTMKPETPVRTAQPEPERKEHLLSLKALLAGIVKEKTGAKVRGIELSLLQRCGAHLASETDIEEAVMPGRAAVENAAAGITDKMVAFERETVDGHYVCKTKLLPLTEVANFEKKIPIEWINDSHNGVKQEFIDYVLPLIQGEPKLTKEDSLPRFAKLKKVLAK